MRLLLTIVLLFSTIINVFSQDVQDEAQEHKEEKVYVRKPYPIRPYFENGVKFLLNNKLQELYRTNSVYFYGVGLKFGNPTPESKFNLFFEFNHLTTTVEKDLPLLGISDSTLTMKQFYVGANFPLYKKKTKDLVVDMSFASILGNVEESFYDNRNNAYGFEIGIGVGKYLYKNSKIFFDVSYNYFKTTTKTKLGDFDTTQFSVGFIL